MYLTQTPRTLTYDEGDISVSDSEDEEPLSNVSARGKQKYTWIKNSTEESKVVFEDFFHFIDLVIVTAWIRYKIDMVNIGLPKKDIIDSLRFRGEVAEGLCSVRKRSKFKEEGKTEWEYRKGVSREEKEKSN
ncbi:hypothetical protein JTB14_028555 [Gonioctena quinquepunctata]|nr:hypothetical protein JTB14_028555 [Gonioctena quinquepunctata]